MARQVLLTFILHQKINSVMMILTTLDIGYLRLQRYVTTWQWQSACLGSLRPLLLVRTLGSKQPLLQTFSTVQPLAAGVGIVSFAHLIASLSCCDFGICFLKNWKCNNHDSVGCHELWRLSF
jgi:hypothetical protein